MTRRQRLLNEMERVVARRRLLAAIEPPYSKRRCGRPPIGLERMRICFLQQWYGLSDEALEDSLYDNIAMCTFAGIEQMTESGAHCRQEQIAKR